MNGGLIDVNVHLSRWPTRRLPEDEPERLIAKLRAVGVTTAWAGSFDALMHKDLAAVNSRLATDCRNHGDGMLSPFGGVNPAAPDWDEELRRCADEHRMPGIRLYPGYHGYTLDHPDFSRLLHQAAERGLVVQLAVTMEDERTMHPQWHVPPVETAPLVGLVGKVKGIRLVLLNALKTVRAGALHRLAAAGEVYFDIAMQEGPGGIGTLLEHVPVERILFGSYAPFFYLESSLLKLHETPLQAAQLDAIRAGNAQRLMAKKREK